MTRAIKGFNSDMTCRGFQFEPGKSYKHDGPVRACSAGFHAVTGYPLDVFSYYVPASSRFFIVELEGKQVVEGDKTAAELLTIGSEIGFTGLTNEAIKWTMDRTHPEGQNATGYGGAASATGYGGAASATGPRGAASATGYDGAASATGYDGAASATGPRGAASATGPRGAASATGPRGAASATGYGGAASATGYGGAASATGDGGAASATGYGGHVKGAAGVILFAVERNPSTYEALSTASGIVGKGRIKADTWYVCRNGRLVKGV